MVKETFSKDMGVTFDDFFRLLPRAMGEHAYTADNRSVTAVVAGGKLNISLGEQQVRAIALMRIPFITVSFDFKDVGGEDIEAFMKHFDLHFQRGGG